MPVIVSFLTALIVTMVITPWMRRLAVWTGIVDRPDFRKVHRQPVPYLGGLAIFAGVAVSLVVTGVDRQTVIALVGSCAVVGLGAIDDAIAMRASIKLLGQLVIATATVGFGISVSMITDPFGGVIQLGWLGFPIAVIWIVGMMNMVNLIDGLDGLAGGVSAISAVSIAIIAMQTGQTQAGLIGVAVAGSAVGFLRYNFSPATIFMGDAGSMFLGYMLAVSALIGVMQSAFTISLAIPIIALAVPIFDTVFAIVRRARRGQPVFSPDKEHFHHQLMAAGLNPKQAVILIYFATGLLGVLAIFLGFLNGLWALGFVVFSICLIVAVLVLFRLNPSWIRIVVQSILD